VKLLQLPFCLCSSCCIIDAINLLLSQYIVLAARNCDGPVTSTRSSICCALAYSAHAQLWKIEVVDDCYLKFLIIFLFVRSEVEMRINITRKMNYCETSRQPYYEGFFSVETTTQKTHLWNMNEQMLLSIYEVAVMVTWLPTCCVVCVSTELVWYDAVVRVYSSAVGQWAECRSLYKSTSSSVKSCTSATARLWVGRSSCEQTAATKISRSAAVYARQWTQVISMVPTNHRPVPDDTAFHCAVKGI